MTTTTGRASAQVVVERMTESATTFLTSLQPQQRQRAVLDFADEIERRRWFYTPTEQGGITLAELYPAQQRLAHRLVATGLSAGAYVTASTIIGLENTLDAREGFGEARPEFATYPGRPSHPRARDPMVYFLSIFGEPGGSAPWGWRFGGHHISIRYTIVDGRIVSPTPTFFGADPADAPQVGRYALRPLAAEEDLGRELLHALDDGQRASAIVCPVAPMDLVLRNRPQVVDGTSPLDDFDIFGQQATQTLAFFRQRNAGRVVSTGYTAEHAEAVRYTSTPKGLPAAGMNGKQREMLTALIRQYIDRMPSELAEPEFAKLSGGAFDAIHFLWAGGTQKRDPHYYRLQGPRFLVEYDNVQNGANHIHSVWRDPEGDFGADILAEHYREAH